MAKKRSRLENTIYNLTSGVVGEFIVYLCNFVCRTVFIRTLGRDYLGIGGLFTNILTMLSLADLGVQSAMNYRMYAPLKDGNTERLKAIMHFYRKVYRVVGLVMLALGCACIPLLPVLIRDYERYIELGIAIPAVFLLYLLQHVSQYLFFAYKSSLIKADQKEYVVNLIGFIVTPVTTIIQIVILFTTRNYFLYIGSVIFINILQAFINAVVVDRRYPFLKEPCTAPLEPAEQREIFKDCFAISLFALSSVVLKATDNLVLSAFIGLDIVGLYSNYLMVYNALKKMIKKVIRSAQSSMGNLFVSESCEKRYQFFGMTSLIMLLCCGTAAVCVAVLADEFITVWIGSEFVIPAPFSILIGAELYTIGTKLVLEQMRDVLGYFQKIRWRPVVEVLLNVIVSVALVNVCGIYGVLIGTLVSEWLTALLIDPFILYAVGFENRYPVRDYFLRNLLYDIELVLCFAVNYFFTGYVFTGHGWLSWIVHAIFCGCSSLAILIGLNCRRKEFGMILSKFTGLLHRFGLKKRKI